ncbi:MAG: hypothetical protein J6R10_06270 [Tidjanibacter sp.]|nr:hypothetical protein [Tidjanibacter sp.]
MYERTIKAALLAMILVACGTYGATAQPQSDRELLRKAHSSTSQSEPTKVAYGIEPGRQTLSPIYHLASSALWVWESFVAPEVCAPGGYADSNTAYYKSLWREYGPLLALPMGFDRMVRNTKIGRASTPTNPQGVIEDDPKRYQK